MIPTQEEVAKAVKILCVALKEDPLYFQAWQANITMAFYDEFCKKFPNDFPVVSIHSIANQAAKNFLDQLINDE